ncbi:uncharacterized protein EV420DRAFT_1274869 [Desarmillaria tabescens]|uniref:MINDY deubiquitinase domain-containing protein n=1 Tax=Armillaria tabescens TaxID=1929756 RepID=A0AA39JWP7_ARMTA|nr:uncharacterized protein EV420DRAFT_1274869 [Desarmillaria tabescens]KAK0450321.1 hypothetical protein EV420DRAFT_1274869 [Desarmillaria tabescens]
MSLESPTIQSSAEVWYLKEIHFGTESSRRPIKIITQNFNGPCSFIAICNILILRGHITIEPPGRQTVSYEHLCQLVGEYLLLNCPDVDISEALFIMPYTQKGMDLNPLFTVPTSFRAGAGELKLFEQVGIDLVHGWLVDPESPEAEVLTRTGGDYDSAVMLIADADHTTKGQLVVGDSEEPQAGPSSSVMLNEEDRQKIEDAIVVRRFLDNTRSQLTYHGLFTLASIVRPGTLVALYRNLHLSVLYKHEQALYSLVTDYVFLKEPSVVWERLEDVDGGSSTFVDSDFVRASPVGGDFAGQTAEDVVKANSYETSDLALAQQLQAEEQNRARCEREFYERDLAMRQAEVRQRKEKRKGKKDCVIM